VPANAVVKHRQISRQLLTEIAEGKYVTSDKLPSEAQLVKRFRVSRPTVGRALRDLQREGVIERRAGSGTYVRARPAAVTASRQLAVLVPDRGSTEIFDLICGELAGLSRAQDYALLFGTPALPQRDRDLSEQDALELCSQFIAQGVMGVFFAPFEQENGADAVNRRIAENLRNAGIAVVLLDRDLVPFPQHSDFDLVGIDNFTAGFLVAQHLLKLSNRNLAFVSRPHSAPTIAARIAGVREALVQDGLTPRSDWIHVGNPEDSRFAATLIAPRRWDAVICANDLTAAQLIRSLEKNNIRVPQDLKIVGFDDAKYGTLLSVPLTTVRQPCRELALIAFRAMIDRIAEPALPARSLSLAPRVVVRESCGAYLPRNPE
jgi:DNA-binding LacI/PurR family transcriptional regulator